MKKAQRISYELSADAQLLANFKFRKTRELQDVARSCFAKHVAPKQFSRLNFAIVCRQKERRVFSDGSFELARLNKINKFLDFSELEFQILRKEKTKTLMFQ